MTLVECLLSSTFLDRVVLPRAVSLSPHVDGFAVTVHTDLLLPIYSDVAESIVYVVQPHSQCGDLIQSSKDSAKIDNRTLKALASKARDNIYEGYL